MLAPTTETASVISDDMDGQDGMNPIRFQRKPIDQDSSKSYSNTEGSSATGKNAGQEQQTIAGEILRRVSSLKQKVSMYTSSLPFAFGQPTHDEQKPAYDDGLTQEPAIVFPAEEVAEAEAVARHLMDHMTDVESMLYLYGYAPKKVSGEMTLAELLPLLRGRRIQGKLLVFCRWLSSTPGFNVFSCLAILLYSVTLFRHDAVGDEKAFFNDVETALVALFVLEFVIRALGSPRCWCGIALMIDAVIVVVCVVDVLILRAYEASASWDDIGNSFLSVAQIYRSLRIIRFLRLFVVASNFRTARLVSRSLGGAFVGAGYAVAVLAFVFYCFALVIRTLLSDVPEESELGLVVDKYFASVFRSMLTLLEVFLKGLNWTDDISIPLLYSGPRGLWVGLLWVGILVFMHLGLASLLVATFVEPLFSCATLHDRDALKSKFEAAAHLDSLKALFREVDDTDRGDITLKQFAGAFKTYPGLCRLFGARPEDAGIVFQELDLQCRGLINADDLLFGVARAKAGWRTMNKLSLDRQMKQIMRTIQHAPRKLELLNSQVLHFEGQVKDMAREVRPMLPNGPDVDFSRRLARLEASMAACVESLSAPPPSGEDAAQVLAAHAAVGAKIQAPALSVANLKETYQLAHSMTELRGEIEAATAKMKADAVALRKERWRTVSSACGYQRSLSMATTSSHPVCAADATSGHGSLPAEAACVGAHQSSVNAAQAVTSVRRAGEAEVEAVVGEGHRTLLASAVSVAGEGQRTLPASAAAVGPSQCDAADAPRVSTGKEETYGNLLGSSLRPV
eukprot:CAMPEP_0117472514 /NCGR_PEP_ID=MMETSP0784-20121206/8286_1 /TAXON_ID=39447 /ORGANISM="" /LENGTH=794 /DNA_ID=CAMNT_0005266667 /DNA_START=24 /DNA_END=2408 /DNA_ORIENTATION=+